MSLGAAAAAAAAGKGPSPSTGCSVIMRLLPALAEQAVAVRGQLPWVAAAVLDARSGALPNLDWEPFQGG